MAGRCCLMVFLGARSIVGSTSEWKPLGGCRGVFLNSIYPTEGAVCIGIDTKVNAKRR